ncbi:MAG: hypothetical protein A2162_03225 [Deltaproteobacteria bacterium RBG_13_52_11b]|nr:MAG: hypothetical protein A2162_03225 [Deltaproteobacteria bacterium RBG_13_52_11b]
MENGNAAYTFRLEGFEGPLDLLLHLIQKNEMDILNIPIAVITEQYLEYLKWMRDLNLDLAGEYLLMASTLLYVKSKTLLPKSSEEGTEEQEEDPRAELLRRLLEYKRYKEAAGELERRPMLGRDVFLRLAAAESEEKGEERVEVNLFELVEAFRKILEGVRAEPYHEVILDPLTVEKKIEEILALLRRENRSISFHLLFPEEVTRRIVVVTFLAILELVKMKLVRIFQLSPFETIRISPV